MWLFRPRIASPERKKVVIGLHGSHLKTPAAHLTYRSTWLSPRVHKVYNKVLGKSSSICWFSFTKPCVKSMLNYAKQTKGLNLLADWRGKIEMVGSCVIKTSVGRNSRPIGRPTISRHVDRLSVDMSAESVDRLYYTWSLSSKWRHSIALWNGC